MKEFPTSFPNQEQKIQPGSEELMTPQPIYECDEYNNNGKRLKDKVAIITGGDSGIGRAVAIAYAKEGAHIAIMYLNENEDANKTKSIIEKYGGKCLLVCGDIGDEKFCSEAIEKITNYYGKINIFVSNAAEQYQCENIEDISTEQLHKTFNTNFFGAFYLTKLILPFLHKGDSIIYTTSVTAYHGNDILIDYSCTKGALTSLTRSLAKNLATKGIRVNAVSPGPIWTPLIPATLDGDIVAKFGSQTSMKRAGQPVEVAESFVFLASIGASYITGETIHVNGGEILNS